MVGWEGSTRAAGSTDGQGNAGKGNGSGCGK